jgi:hypothetical protein
VVNNNNVITWVAREQVYELGVPDNVRKDISAMLPTFLGISVRATYLLN